jgi:hypothetical protein
MDAFFTTRDEEPGRQPGPERIYRDMDLCTW